MHGCSVTCVLIGVDTHRSKWVNFEISELIANRMGLVGIYIHKLKDQQGDTLDLIFDPHNPLGDHEIPPHDFWTRLFPDSASDRYETHTWNPPDSFWGGTTGEDLGAWVEEAVRRAGRS